MKGRRWIRSKRAPEARKSLAQHEAAGGVLGKVENYAEPRRGGMVSHTDSSALVKLRL